MTEGNPFSGTGETASHDAPAPAADPAMVEQLMHKLKALLEDNDAEAADVLDQLVPLVKGTARAARFKPVGRAIAEFDFDVALEALTALIATETPARFSTSN